MDSAASMLEQVRSQWRRLDRQERGDVRIMEVCGTHTIAVARAGLRGLLPAGVRLISGPGCPVCVTDQTYMDQAVHLAREHREVLIATYGDMVRVPGRLGTLEDARSEGAEVEVVYAAHEALDLARRRPDKQVVFLGIGFETTAPATALTLLRARREGVGNFCVFCAHKLVVPAMQALLELPDVRIDGFLCPGHVSVIIGFKAYEPLVERFGRPCVVAGFEEAQILAGIGEILRELAQDDAAACSVYPVVSAEGNPTARAVIAEVFDVADAAWRALGTIPASGLVLKDAFREFDAAERFELPELPGYELPGCRCGEVISGRALPTECSLFGSGCTPRSPVGPCMVSSEGTCAAYYKYERPRRARAGT